jgi:hypothetical protein
MVAISGNEENTRIVVRFQTAEGKIKKYRTVYGADAYEGYYGKYVTNCGREWKKNPSQTKNVTIWTVQYT